MDPAAFLAPCARTSQKQAFALHIQQNSLPKEAFENSWLLLIRMRLILAASFMTTETGQRYLQKARSPVLQASALLFIARRRAIAGRLALALLDERAALFHGADMPPHRALAHGRHLCGHHGNPDANDDAAIPYVITLELNGDSLAGFKL